MDNFKIFSFQKNKYFYGKLLTVRDFELEQKYTDEKRYLINRIMFGSGIAAGLMVSKVDEQTIVVEPGFAMDNLGREIIVPENITEKLNFIEGFENAHSKDLYLCLDYKEYGKERVHSMVGEFNEAEELREYSRIQESYQLTIKEIQQEDYIYNNLNGGYKKSIIYEDENVSIETSYPYVVNTNEVFQIVLEINKKRVENLIEFNYVFKSEFFHNDYGDQSNIVNFNFKEQENKKEGYYKFTFNLKAEENPSEEAIIFIEKSSFKLKINGIEESLDDNILLEFKITEGNKKEKLLQEFNKINVDDRFKLNSLDTIYLAKIEIIPLDSSYIIDKVVPAPFNQYVYNNDEIKNISLLKDGDFSFNIKTDVETKIVDNIKEANVDVIYDNKLNKFKFKFNMPKKDEIPKNITTGIVEMNTGNTALFGKSIFSEEINHGLGKGDVCVQVGMEEEDEMVLGKEKRIYYGDPQVFYKSEYEADQNIYNIGVIVYPENGTFRIGLRIQTSDKDKNVKLRWWACKS